MKENETKHTIILTIDKATVDTTDQRIFDALNIVMGRLGLVDADNKDKGNNPNGLYYSREIVL